MSSSIDKLFVGLQRLTPTGLLGRMAYSVSRWEWPWMKNTLIRVFIKLYGIDLREAAGVVPGDYSSLNAFFTRELKPGCRPLDPDPAAICSPCDGCVQQLGEIRDDELIQAKSLNYRLGQLLGEDKEVAARYRDGAFLTIYLAPHHYHRVHAPLGGAVQEMVYVPGKRMAVNRTTARTVAGLFATNERLLCHCSGPPGYYSVLLVGAMNVSCISTAWSGEVLPHKPREIRCWSYADEGGIHLEKGDYLGRFELGSTVILLMPPGSAAWSPGLAPGREVRVGQRVGTLRAGPPGTAP